jgi:hypothetical protein
MTIVVNTASCMTITKILHNIRVVTVIRALDYSVFFYYLTIRSI